MIRKSIHKTVLILLPVVLMTGCKVFKEPVVTENKNVPASFAGAADSLSVKNVSWKEYFADENLHILIDSALKRNQELNIALREIDILRNEVNDRRGEYLPFVALRADAGLEKEGRFTRHGAVDATGEILPGKEFPDPLPNYGVAMLASWEVDIWKKLRNAKKSAALRFLAGSEGRNFLITNLIAEIANSYYELLALDNQLNIIRQNIGIQTGMLEVVKQQMASAKLTQLAVNRFEAQLLNTKNRQYEIQQKIVEVENRISFLTGSFPTHIPRSSASFVNVPMDSVSSGLPAYLFENRPDIRQAELQLAAAKLDVSVARAEFLPALRLVGGVGIEAFDVSRLLNPESLLFNVAGDLIAPLVNRNAIKARYRNATAMQAQAVYNYEQTVLNAYVDVVNNLAAVRNFDNSFLTKSQEAGILMQSVSISNSLFRSARADYLEVLLTQQEALESKMELVEIKQKQMNARVNLYRSLGGGWTN